MSYVKIKIPDELKAEIRGTLETIADSKNSKIRIRMNEVTKSIERGLAKLVVMAENVNPPEILFHIPLLCDEKGIPYGYLSKKEMLGRAVNINVSSSAIAIEETGGNDKIVNEVVKKINALK